MKGVKVSYGGSYIGLLGLRLVVIWQRFRF
jgi:hypothetical protein